MDSKNLFVITLMLLALLLIGSHPYEPQREQGRRSIDGKATAVKYAGEFAAAQQQQWIKKAADDPRLILQAMAVNSHCPER